MANKDNKPTKRHLIYATDLRPKDLCDVERYFEERGASEFVYDEKLDIFRFPKMAGLLSVRSLLTGNA